jgi:hypothetical protein
LRTEGLARLVEEDQLNPVDRVVLAAGKWRWRQAHAVAPRAVPVFVAGVQRSGTNMVVRGLERAPEFEVYNENDRRAFDRFQLRPDPVVRELVLRSGHRYVLFKPLCDSHRVTDLLDSLRTPSRGRAIWIYRSVEGRVRSAVAKFGASNLDALRQIAEGRGAGMWQAGGLSEEHLRMLRQFDYTTMTPATGAALFWLVRNSLYFDLGLHARPDVGLVSYDAFVRDPVAEMQLVCSFLGFPFRPELVSHVRVQGPLGGQGSASSFDPSVLERCQELATRLDEARGQKRDLLLSA